MRVWFRTEDSGTHTGLTDLGSRVTGVGCPHPVKTVVCKAFRCMVPAEQTVQDQVVRLMHLYPALCAKREAGMQLPLSEAPPLHTTRPRPFTLGPRAGRQTHPRNPWISDKCGSASHTYCTRSGSATSCLKGEGYSCTVPLRGGAKRRICQGQGLGRAVGTQCLQAEEVTSTAVTPPTS